MKEPALLSTQVESWKSIRDKAESALELFELALIDGDEDIISGIVDEAGEIANDLSGMEFQLTLSGEYDQRDAILALHAGAGGIDSQDWASKLCLLYTSPSPRD